MSWINSILPGLDKNKYIKHDDKGAAIFNIGKALSDLDNGLLPGCFGDIKKPKLKPLPQIFQNKKISKLNSLPNVKIFNNGTTGSFVVKDKTFIVNQTTGSITVKTKSGFEKTFSTIADLSGFDQDDFKNGEGVSIKLGSSRNGTLTLYPAPDGVHTAKAEITWPESRPLTRAESMQTIMRARLENRITVDNIATPNKTSSKNSDKSGLQITPEQYDTNRARTVLF